MTLSRTSRILSVAALVALAAFLSLELPRRRAEEDASVAARRLFPPFQRAADRVDIARPHDRILIEVQGTHWEMLEPLRDAAELSRVATLLDALERAEVERDLGPADDPAQYGLSPPTAVVTVTSTGDTLAHLEIGHTTIDGAFVFARRHDGDVVLVPPALATAATLPTPAYRDQNVVRFDIDSVTSFVTARGRETPTHWYRRGTDDAWFTIVAGDTVAGDSVEVPMYLRRFRGMRVRAFVDPADTTGAFAHLAGRVTLRKRGPAPPVTLRFAARSDSVYWCRIDGGTRVVVVQGNVPGALDASPATLRDRRVLQFSPAHAKRIHVVTADTSAVLVRAGDAWALPNPALGRVDSRSAAEFIRALRALRYRRVMPGSVRDAEPATLTLLISAEGDTIIDELRARPRGGASDSWLVTSRSSRVLAEVTAGDITTVIDRLRRVRTSGR